MRLTLFAFFALAFCEASSKILTPVQRMFNVFAKHIEARDSSLTVDGRLATYSSSTYHQLSVGGALPIETCPTPHPLCPLEEVIHLSKSAYYSHELPKCSKYAGKVYPSDTACTAEHQNSVTVERGIAYHVGNVEYDDNYDGVQGWTFSTADDGNVCGPNKIYDTELVDFDAEIAALAFTSEKLKNGNTHGSEAGYLDGFICHDNKLIVIPVIEGIGDLTVRPVIRYALPCDKFNILNEYEIYSRNGKGTVQPILAFSIEAGDESGNCIVSGGSMSSFQGLDRALVWNYVGSGFLSFSQSGTFFGTFLAAASENSGIECTVDTDVQIIGNVLATTINSLSGKIVRRKLNEGSVTDDPID